MGRCSPLWEVSCCMLLSCSMAPMSLINSTWIGRLHGSDALTTLWEVSQASALLPCHVSMSLINSTWIGRLHNVCSHHCERSHVACSALLSCSWPPMSLINSTWIGRLHESDALTSTVRGHVACRGFRHSYGLHALINRRIGRLKGQMLSPGERSHVACLWLLSCSWPLCRWSIYELIDFMGQMLSTHCRGPAAMSVVAVISWAPLCRWSPMNWSTSWVRCSLWEVLMLHVSGYYAHTPI
jgi:hypothetical protein